MCIYGQFAGAGISKNTAMADVDRMFIIFDICFFDSARPGYQESNTPLSDILMYYPIFYIGHYGFPEIISYITNYETWGISIHEGNPEKAKNDLELITKSVALCCPVAAYFEKYGPGSGTVWKNSTGFPGCMFKMENNLQKGAV